MVSEVTGDQIASVRRFNRVYTRRIGALREGFLHSPFSLTETRILWELANRDNLTASHLMRDLGIDAAYLSRAPSRFEQQGLVERSRAEHDGRQRLLSLTKEGREAFAVVDKRALEEVAELLNNTSESERGQLLRAMRTTESILDKNLKFSEPFFIRSHQPGDMGWVTHRHGVLYSQEYGWDELFEALVAGIVSDFITDFKPYRECCFIAEMGGEIVGSVFCVQASETVAQLRLLLVEPKARGMGSGSRLVQECILFARRARYETLRLWTNSCLLEAPHIYEKHGFKLVPQEPHHSFGHDLTGETWELAL